MKKALLCVVLAVVLVLGIVAMAPVSTRAASNMSLSDECVEIIKDIEGFRAIPYWDYSQWTVGFGSTCPSDRLSRYQKEGIPLDEAHDLMMEQLARFEASVNSFIDKHGLKLTQGQYDALVSFSYNLGASILNSTSNSVVKAILSGATGNEMIRAFTMFCTAGGEFLPGLMRRRLVESAMYLYGYYDGYAPADFCYILYDANGGEKEVSAQGYYCKLPAQPMSVPTYKGHTFLGWYTKPVGGQKVTSLDASTHGMTLYAHWSDGSGTSTPVGNVKVTVTADYVNIRSGPGSGHDVVGGVEDGDELVITSIVEIGSTLWGQCQQGWICLDYTNYDDVTGSGGGGTIAPPMNPPSLPPKDDPDIDLPKAPIGATVLSSSGVTIYNGPHTTFPKKGTLKQGEQVELLEFVYFYDTIWGRYSGGWIQVTSKVLLQDESTLDHSFQLTITHNNLNIREAAGTDYAVVGRLDKNAVVKILALTQADGAYWGRIDKGWINLDYTNFDPAKLPQYQSHSYGAWYDVQPGTCVTPGLQRRDCVDCGHSETRETPLSGHSFGDWYQTKTPTETQAGEERRDCNNCSHYEVRAVQQHAHTYGKWTEFKKATCTAAGEERRNCSQCDHYESRAIQALGHNYSSWYKQTQATCTAAGEERRPCTRCDHFESRLIKKLGHSYGSWYTYKEATASQEGEERRECVRCDHYEQRVIEKKATVITKVYGTMTNSSYSAVNIRSGAGSSYSVVGSIKRGTTVEILEQKTVDGVLWGRTTVGWVWITGNLTLKTVKVEAFEFVTRSYANVVCNKLNIRAGTGNKYSTQGTLEKGSVVELLEIVTVSGQQWGRFEKGWICLTKNAVLSEYVEDAQSAHSHTYGKWEIVKKATCTDAGEQRRSCAGCKLYESYIQTATGHSYQTVVTAPTCLEKGYTTHTCKNCADSYVDTYVDALGHRYGAWEETKAPGCTTSGEMRRTCSNCKNVETKSVEATGHSYQAAVTAPTCLEKGYTTHTCKNCADSYVDSYVDALGHSYESVVTEPSCTQEGYTTYTCGNCDHSYVDDYVAILDHSWDDGVVTKEPTEEEAGVMLYQCSICGATQEAEIPALEHIHSYESVVTEPTCTQQGYTTYTCPCEDSYIDDYVDALGHAFTEYISDGNATTEADGTKTACCDREGCDATDTVTDPGSKLEKPEEPSKPAEPTQPNATEPAGTDKDTPDNDLVLKVLILAGVLCLLVGGIIALVVHKKKTK